MQDITELTDEQLREIIETQPFHISFLAQCELQYRLTGDAEDLIKECDENG